MQQPKDANGDGIPDPIANCTNPPWGWSNGNGNPGGNSGNCPGAGGNGGGNGGGGGSFPEVFEKDQYYYHPDHLGSSSYVTDLDGEIFQHLEYFPFGETWVEEHSNTQRTPYLFTAKELDEETGLYYFGARYYDPRTSVWQSPDPILAKYMQGQGSGGGVFNPPNLSLYAYVHHRPVVAFDPDGNEMTWAEVWASMWNPFTASSMQMKTEPHTTSTGRVANVPSGDTIGSIAARWAYTGPSPEATKGIFTGEGGNKETAGGTPYRAGSQNAMRHIVLSAFAHNELNDPSGVDAILNAHESEYLGLDIEQRSFATGMEADSVADRLNNEIGKQIAGEGGRTRKEVLIAIAEYGRDKGFFQVRTNPETGAREVYQSKLTAGQFSQFMQAIEAKDDNGEWLE